jgi:uncharacterized protein (TIGR02271 family)
MIDNTERWTADQIPTGATVYDAGGEKVGSVAEYIPETGYLLVEKGWLFIKDLYIPASAISRIDDDSVYLRLYKDDLKDERYTNPPVAGMADRTAAAYDSAAATNAALSSAPGGLGAIDTTPGMTTGRSIGAADRDALSSSQTDIRVPVREEELVVGKQQQEEGRVHLHKDVVEEPQTVDVALRQERVTVERVPYSGDVTATDNGELFQERDIDVPVMGEEAVVAKRVQGVEEVRVHKDVVTGTQQFSDSVRKERVTVDGVQDDADYVDDVQRPLTDTSRRNI